MNSCCFCFSLRTGIILMIFYELAYLLLQYFIVETWEIFMKDISKDIAFFFHMRSVISKTILVEVGLYLVCYLIAMFAISKEDGTFLFPLLILKTLMIIVDAIIWFLSLLLFTYKTEDDRLEAKIGLLVFFIGVISLIEGVVVHFWFVIYNYYMHLKGDRRGDPANYDPRAGGQPRAQGGSPYDGPRVREYPRGQGGSPYDGPRVREYPRDQGGSPYDGPRVREYPRDQDGSPYDGPRVSGYLRRQGGSPHGDPGTTAKRSAKSSTHSGGFDGLPLFDADTSAGGHAGETSSGGHDSSPSSGNGDTNGGSDDIVPVVPK